MIKAVSNRLKKVKKVWIVIHFIYKNNKSWFDRDFVLDPGRILMWI